MLIHRIFWQAVFSILIGLTSATYGLVQAEKSIEDHAGGEIHVFSQTHGLNSTTVTTSSEVAPYKVTIGGSMTANLTKPSNQIIEERRQVIDEKENFFNSNTVEKNLLKPSNNIPGPTNGTQTAMNQTNDPNQIAQAIFRTKVIDSISDPNFRIIAKYDNVPNDHQWFRNEPSVATGNNLIFYVGTFYAAVSEDGGQRWRYVDLYSQLPFSCCDQNIIFDPHNGIFIWTMMDMPEDHGTRVTNITIGVSRNLIDWALYNVSRTTFNPNWNDQAFDFPQSAISNGFLYLTANRMSNFNTESQKFEGAIVARVDLRLLAAASPISLQYVQFAPPITTITPVQGATDVMYMGSHLSASTDSWMRVFKWQDNSGMVNWVDREIPAWTSMDANSSTGMVCPGPDGHDWCGMSDTRITNGWIVDSKVGFFWNTPSGNGFPYPYINAATFDRQNLQYLSRPYIWSPNHAWMYAASSPSSEGLGIVAIYGGGPFYPSIAAGLRNDTFEPTGTWHMNSVVAGTNGPNANEWGDYVHVAPFGGTGPYFAGSGFTLRDGDTPEHLINSYFVFGSDASGSKMIPAANYDWTKIKMVVLNTTSALPP